MIEKARPTGPAKSPSEVRDLVVDHGSNKRKVGLAPTIATSKPGTRRMALDVRRGRGTGRQVKRRRYGSHIGRRKRRGLPAGRTGAVAGQVKRVDKPWPGREGQRIRTGWENLRWVGPRPGTTRWHVHTEGARQQSAKTQDHPSGDRQR